jgi:hypothetical protein
VVDKMSIQYQIVFTGNSLEQTFNEIKKSFLNDELYSLTFSDENSACFALSNSISDWGSDFDLFTSEGKLYIEIHAGNSKRILLFIHDLLKKLNILAEFEEI